ncbi:MAG: hypothetical protein ACK4N5_04760, partial [Myxococcales bacterium]
LRPFPGYTSEPRHASAEAGAFFAAALLDTLAPVVSAVLAGAERSPPPVMGWLGPLSLGGRLGNLPIPRGDELLEPELRG